MGEEVRRLSDDHGVNVILFTDEYPTQDQDRWEEILDRIIALDRDLYLLMETRAADIVRDERFLHKYRQAGIVHVYVGLEATEQETLDRIDKQSSVEEGRESLRLIREYGMLSRDVVRAGLSRRRPRRACAAHAGDGAELRPRHGSLPGHHPVALLGPVGGDQGPHQAVTDYSKYNLIEPIIEPQSR